jgi:hypothetical protein
MSKYQVRRKVEIVYQVTVEAETLKEAELIAEDMGTFNADQDSSRDTGWKARLIID